jgi:hypothetical protein
MLHWDMTTLTLDLKELLLFFDERPAESRGHAAALIGLFGEELGVGFPNRKRVRWNSTCSSAVSAGTDSMPRSNSSRP